MLATLARKGEEEGKKKKGDVQSSTSTFSHHFCRAIISSRVEPIPMTMNRNVEYIRIVPEGFLCTITMMNIPVESKNASAPLRREREGRGESRGNSPINNQNLIHLLNRFTIRTFLFPIVNRSQPFSRHSNIVEETEPHCVFWFRMMSWWSVPARSSV